MIERKQLRRFIPSPILKARRNLYRPFYLSRSLAKLRAVGSVSTIDEAWQVATEFRGWGEFETIRPTQRKSELCSLLELLRAETVQVACEIGSFLGGTLFMMTRVLPDDAHVLSIDWPDAPAALGSFPRSRKAFHEGFSRADQCVTVIHGNSREAETIKVLATALRGKHLDFLMIDGDHSLEGVKADFYNFSPFVRRGGLIAFHDIIAEDTERLYGYKFGAPEFWQQLREQYRTCEFIDPETTRLRNGGGIGVLWWDGGSNEPFPPINEAITS